MRTLRLDSKSPAIREHDWDGDHAAFTCPLCANVFVVDLMLYPTGRKCPECRKSKGYVKGVKNFGGFAYIEWKDSNQAR